MSTKRRIMDERNYLIHPQYLAMGLLLMGITALFLGFSAAYLYNRVQAGLEPIQLPILFVFNALILVGSSLTLNYARSYYKEDKTRKYQQALSVTLLLTIVFLGSQIVAWMQMYDRGLFVNNDNMTSYLYIISIVHFAHVIAGIPFLGIFLYKSIKLMKEPVSVLVYFSDPYKKRHLNLLTMYWHFLDFLWIYLVLFFLINSFI
ncbi:MAG: cytochrome c oxidase subunit III [Saprospiraceae bacterium]|nr:cytochrome c oxidase subunit III [Saprospiraceae bacterium]